MPRGEEDEIPERADPLLFFFAPTAARAFLVFATSNPSLFRESIARRHASRGDSGLVANRHGNESGTDFQIAGPSPPRNAGRDSIGRNRFFYRNQQLVCWLGREGSNLRMAESKSARLCNDFKAPLEETVKTRFNNLNRLAAVSKYKGSPP
ncbi:hypothetical protein H8A95_05470 [Bradyrhizobium sp. Pear76]|uniref:hypothetical protein n=1 Tax=Bradyrhizobium oropedii TaxID=1571201 RepID=UPI001E47DCAB|nr:hypothetical protein [Bradyrhizobium oropedii]MCC8961785.1 hypothetical protein [Bradyrhizobium oropedii]